MENFGFFLIILSACVLFYTSSFVTIFSKKGREKARLYKEKCLIEKNKSINYKEEQQAFCDVIVSFSCFLVFFIGVILIIFI